MLKEFKEFALKGNLMDMAVGVVIGTAFGKIVTSIVDDLVMPLISLLTGKVNFTDLFIALDGGNYATLAEAQIAGASTLNYGNFITSIVDFLIIAFSIFIVIRQINKLEKKFEKVTKKQPVTTKKCPYCKSEIDIEATKCPHCISELDKEEIK